MATLMMISMLIAFLMHGVMTLRLGGVQQECKCTKAPKVGKDAIVFLAKNKNGPAQEGSWKRGNSAVDFNHSLLLLYRNFNDCHRKDVLVFHNGDFEEDDQQHYKNVYGASLKFHTLEKGGPYWSLPPAAGLQESDLKKWRAPQFSMGYRHMMRWYGILIYKYLADRGYDWYMRLDDDSKLLSCIDYDLFQFMRDNHLAYGYRQLAIDKPAVSEGIGEMARQYIGQHKHKIPTEFTKHFVPAHYTFDPSTNRFVKKPSMNFVPKKTSWDRMGPYNNFLISKLSFWTSPEVQAWLRHVDSSGLQYKNRTSDLPVQAITLEMFMPAKQVHKFTDFGYSHFTLTSSNECKCGALSWPANKWTPSVLRHLPRGSQKLGENGLEVMYGCPLGFVGLFNWL